MLNLGIIAFPLMFSFERRLKFYSKIKPLLIAMLLVGCVFVGWDVWATYRGHWSFNPSYVNDTRFLGIPLEELLFFVTVPYSCLFVFDSIKYFIGDKELFSPNRQIFTVAGFLVAALAFGFLDKGYTFLAILSVGLTFLFVATLKAEIFASRSYWIYITATLFLFLIFNFILTSLPVVQYSSLAICNIRFITIPLEDFLFNFSMLTSYLTVYLWASGIHRQNR
ncbi:MAG: lycopene cyclase domain-containing protein [Candidatus Bathyarchaeota archaeon]|nr:MAG: lycopene cyclase domain-containing protein [Candidatus Bathyarchaeota archaeon]